MPSLADRACGLLTLCVGAARPRIPSQKCTKPRCPARSDFPKGHGLVWDWKRGGQWQVPRAAKADGRAGEHPAGGQRPNRRPCRKQQEILGVAFWPTVRTPPHGHPPGEPMSARASMRHASIYATCELPRSPGPGDRLPADGDGPLTPIHGSPVSPPPPTSSLTHSLTASTAGVCWR